MQGPCEICSGEALLAVYPGKERFCYELCRDCFGKRWQDMNALAVTTGIHYIVVPLEIRAFHNVYCDLFHAVEDAITEAASAGRFGDLL